MNRPKTDYAWLVFYAVCGLLLVASAGIVSRVIWIAVYGW